MPLFCAYALAGCELQERGAVAPPEAMLVLHAVLTTSVGYQTLLLERTWNGGADIWRTGREYLSSDPIRTGGGVGVQGALVEVMTPAGSAVEGREPIAPPGRGADEGG